MNAIVFEVETVCSAPAAARTARGRPLLRGLGLRRARAAVLRFLEALIVPGPPSPLLADETDWPRYPGF
jgi:hypothetical protein